MIPNNIKKHFIDTYFKLTGKSLNISKTDSLSGGSINKACKITTDAGNFFIKWNKAELYPEMFATEAKGLKLLSETKAILIPKIIMQESCDGYDYLILEYIKEGAADTNFWRNFGKNLASLHSVKNEYFGLDHDNYIGSLKQYNNKHNTWISFFIEQRLEIQIRLARDNNSLQSSDIRAFESLFNKLPEIFPEEVACLIHGDLWSGNYLAAEGGVPSIIDPAVYYGHREMDIAMTKLFGGFSKEFYSSYNNYYALERNWEKRIDICNLYPLLVHLNLFGGGYLHEVKSIIKQF